MPVRFKALVPLFFLFLAAGCTADGREYTDIRIGTADIRVELARTPEERQQGLMNRKSLPVEEGMLFIFEKEQRMSFWMKDTSIPLSIAYISKSGEIKEIYDMEPFSQSPVPSRFSVLYALEVNQGFFEDKGIGPGDRVEFSF
ncbi:MAG: DUF192 domain-containing protein [Spirochaetales bacterium]|nr:DUF192 domain-containing protein [Spirochaetales bacterium]